jgi:hypothetical protein
MSIRLVYDEKLVKMPYPVCVKDKAKRVEVG